jgi:hypothetical protein
MRVCVFLQNFDKIGLYPLSVLGLMLFLPKIYVGMASVKGFKRFLIIMPSLILVQSLPDKDYRFFALKLNTDKGYKLIQVFMPKNSAFCSVFANT